MLTRQAKAVLKQFQKLTNYSESSFTRYIGEFNFFLLEDPSQCVDLSKYSNEIVGIIELLESDGYLICDSNGSESRLTPAGIHREYLEWVKIRLFLLRSILVPIIVSAVTTLLTLWLTK
jgi:hypothetical protein